MPDRRRGYTQKAKIAGNTVYLRTGEYADGDEVSVCTEGKIWVRVPDGLTGCSNKPAYVIDLIADGDYKKFTATSGANTYDPGCWFRSNPITLGTGQTFALVEVRGVK